MLLLLLNYVVLRALLKIDVYLISTLVNKSLYYHLLKSVDKSYVLQLLFVPSNSFLAESVISEMKSTC